MVAPWQVEEGAAAAATPGVDMIVVGWYGHSKVVAALECLHDQPQGGAAIAPVAVERRLHLVGELVEVLDGWRGECVVPLRSASCLGLVFPFAEMPPPAKRVPEPSCVEV